MVADRQVRRTQRTLALLQVVERSGSERARTEAIDELASQQDSDSGRVLVEYYEYSQWRSIKIDILRALGRMNQQRTVEFLLRVASDVDDLALAGEAVVALGSTGDASAGEFLLTLVERKDHPLRREAIVALSRLDEFACDRELGALLSELDPPPTLVQYAILAAGSRGDVSTWPHVERHLRSGPEGNGAVFNAALLAAGQLATPASRDALESLDLRYRFFANSLRLASLERIHSRLRLSIEDSVSEVLTATDPRAELEALRSLRRFPIESAWEAFELLAGTSSHATNLLARCVLFDAARAEKDLAFLHAHFEELPIERVAALTRLHGVTDPSFWEKLIAPLSARSTTRLFSKVRISDGLSTLDAIIASERAPREDRVEAVNALVAQAQMTGRRSETTAACARIVMARIAQVEDPGLVHRLVRALGQLGREEPEELTVLENAFKIGGAHSSVYLALAGLGGEQAAWVVLRRIKKILEQKSDPAELELALGTLARMGTLPTVAPLKRIPPLSSQRRTTSMLKILCANEIEGFNELVLAALSSEDFQTAMLALAAARLNHDEAIWSKVEALALSPDPCIAGRAVHSLCHGASVRQHKRLLENLDQQGGAETLMLSVLRDLEPAVGVDYRPIVTFIDERLAKREGLFGRTEVYAAATGLRDNLVFAGAKARTSMRPPSMGDPSGEASLHIVDVDRTLAERIPGFHRFNEIVKSTLRNAELTHAHPELFDDRVDKSTMVVEYVKSIDLLLQETLGGQIFSRKALAIPMQSRVIELQLDDDTLPVWQWIKELEIGAPFSIDSFPSHKLVTLGRAILSGKLWHAPHRIVDGLRAWGLLLLVFGREFVHRSAPKTAILRMRSTNNADICRTAYRLNELQAIRNEAAHRGTMLRTSEVEQIREQSFEVLAELDALLY